MRTLLSLSILLFGAATYVSAAVADEGVSGQPVAPAQPSAPPPAQLAPTPQTAPPPAQSYPQAYPQQGQPQQAYPQQAYPQQAYPQQYQGYPQQYPPQRPARAPRPSRGMLIAGTVVLSVSYGVSLFSGAVLLDTSCCEDAGAALLIPIAGPFVAASVVDDGKSVLTLLGMVQVVGAGLLIGGIIKYKRSKRQLEADGYYAWDLPHGRKLSLDAAASPRMVGPSLRLKF